MVGSLINVTGSSATTVNPIALYMELGSNPGVQNKWFNTKSPDNLIGLNVATENDAPQPSRHCAHHSHHKKEGAFWTLLNPVEPF